MSLKIDFLSAEARLEFVGNKYRENYNHLLNQPYGIYLANRLHFKFRREKWPELWKNLISSRPVVAFPWQMGKDCSLGWNVNSVSITPEKKKEKKRRKNLRWIKTMTMLHKHPKMLKKWWKNNRWFLAYCSTIVKVAITMATGKKRDLHDQDIWRKSDIFLDIMEHSQHIDPSLFFVVLFRVFSTQ